NTETLNWLVISGPCAQFQATGEVNGDGRVCKFLVTVTDGAQAGGGGVDRFRLKMIDDTGLIVYDNMRGAPDDLNLTSQQPIASGDIVLFLNTPPAVSSSSLDSNTINEGGQATLTGTFTDPDAGQTHTVTINWGDGTANTNISIAAGIFTFSATHTFKATATVINVRVADNFGATVTGSTPITANNVAPVIGTVTKTPAGAVAIGVAASVKVNFRDPGDLATHTCTYARGDGVA